MFDDEQHVATPSDFASEMFALNNIELFDEYIKRRIEGESSYVAFRIAFGEEFVGDNFVQARIYGIERNPYFVNHFKKRLEATKLSDMWNPKVAVHNLLMMARDVLAKESARLGAMKELNLITRLVVIDESGKSKAGRSLADFYADEGELAPDPEPEPEIKDITPRITH